MFLTEAILRRSGFCAAVALCAVGVMSGMSVSRGIFSLATFLITGCLSVCMGILTWFLTKNEKEEGEERVSATPSSWLLWALTLFFQAVPFILMLVARTDQGIASPWQICSERIFIAYGISCFVAFFVIDHLGPKLARIILGIQALLFVGLVYFVYQLGFGYDPFVHQAAERYLSTHGMISPASILYSGHYGLVVFFSRLLFLDPAFLDRALVPIGTVVLALLLCQNSLRAWLGKEARSISFFAFFLLPCLPLAFTVPHNLTYLLLVVIILLLPKIRTSFEYLWLGGWIALFSLFIHPLLGIPITVLVSCAGISRRLPRLAPFFAFFLTFFGMLAAFLIYLGGAHGSLLPFEFSRLTHAVIVLLGAPIIPWTASARYVLFYKFWTIWPLLLIGGGFLGLRKLEPDKRILGCVLSGVALGVAMIALFLAAFVRIQNILPGEQFEFALRLRYTLPLFFLPGLFVLFHTYLSQAWPKKLLVGVFVAVLATIVWYGSYPQYNIVMRQSAPGLRRADLEAVQRIEALSAGKPYLALTPQMVSAAALTTIGFEREVQTKVGPRYLYPIPTGGELYAFYLRLWHVPDCHLFIQSVFDFISPKQLYIVMPQAWDPKGVIDARLRPCMDARESIGFTTVLYRFLKP